MSREREIGQARWTVGAGKADRPPLRQVIKVHPRPADEVMRIARHPGLRNGRRTTRRHRVAPRQIPFRDRRARRSAAT